MTGDQTVTPFCVAITPHCCEPSSPEVSARASTSRVPPEIATVLVGLAVKVPANREPSDTDTEKLATACPRANCRACPDAEPVATPRPDGVAAKAGTYLLDHQRYQSVHNSSNVRAACAMRSPVLARSSPLAGLVAATEMR
jgi:hypothetical protein